MLVQQLQAIVASLYEHLLYTLVDLRYLVASNELYLSLHRLSILASGYVHEVITVYTTLYSHAHTVHMVNMSRILWQVKHNFTKSI